MRFHEVPNEVSRCAAVEAEALTHTAIGRTAAGTFPFRWICALEFTPVRRGRKQRSKDILGTGTLVGPRAVLTAAHVVEEFAAGGERPAADLRITPGRAGRHRPFGTRRASRVILPAAWIADPAPGSPADFAMVIADGDFSPSPGHWGMARASDDARGSRLGALNGWRPGRYMVNHSGYASRGHGFQDHWFADTFGLGGVVGDLLFIDSRSRRGESGSPVWVSRHRSLGGRHLWAMVVSAPDNLDPGGRAREVEALIASPGSDFLGFIEAHRGRTS